MSRQPIQGTTTHEYFREAHDFVMNSPQFNNYNVSVPEDVKHKLEQKLKPISGTWLDKNKICLEGTRTTIIEEISQWISHRNVPQTYILCGEAGTGKSTIGHTIGAKFENWLGAFFCFSRRFAATRTPSNALCTIAYRLGIKFPVIANKLIQTFEVNPNILESTSIQELWKTLIVTPAQMIAQQHQPVLIVIDALDESGGREEEGPRAQLLSLLINSTHDLPGNFHVFVTSRPESDIIEHLLEQEASDIQSSRVQYMDDIPGTRDDIFQYVCSRMMRNRVTGRLQEHQCKMVAERATGFFQWAAIVCTSLSGQGKGGLSVSKRFDRFMTLNPSNAKDLHALDGLYGSILEDAFDIQDTDVMAVYRSIMSQVLAAFEPLSQAGLQSLQPGSDENAVTCVLSFLGSLFTGISKSENAQVRPVHTSVLDFLLDKQRSKQFGVDLGQGHQLLADGAFHVMFRDLHFNMGNLESSYMLNSEIEDLEIKLSKGIKPELIYACSYWDLHIQNIEPSDSWLQQLEIFFFNYSLYWMEVLGLMKRIHIASRAAINALTFVGNMQVIMNKELRKFIQEIPQFIQAFGKMITAATPHLYLSGIPFIPKQSSLHTVYKRCCHPGKQAVFSAQMLTWPDQQVIYRGHTSGVNAVAFSPDGKRIVSGSDDDSIRIWNADTGEVIGNPLQGHSNAVTSVAFSPDGKKIVSGSDDSSIRIWDTDMGEASSVPLQGHLDWVNSVAFSPDGKTIISGSRDKTIRIWNATTREAIGDPLQGHLKAVTSVVFSPDGKRIVSGSWDSSIRIWNATTGEAIGDPLQGHIKAVTSVAYSPDATRIVSGSDDKSIRIWDTNTGEGVGDPLWGHSNRVTSVTFSPDSKRIVSGSWDLSIRIWSADTGEEIGNPLQGHSEIVTTVATSPDGRRIVSGSQDFSIRIWNAKTEKNIGEPSLRHKGHSEIVTSVGFSPDGKRIVSGSGDCSIRIWNADTGEAIADPLQGHSSSVSSVGFSPDGRRIISGSWDSTIRMWNADTGEAIGNPLQGHSEAVNSIAFSPDGNMILSGSDDNSIRIWNASTGREAGDPLQGHLGPVTSVTFSPDGKRILSGSRDRSIRIWNADTGEAIGDPLQGHSKIVTSVVFSPDGKRIMSGSWDSTIRIWNADTGEVIGDPLQEHSDWVTSVSFSPDGKRIVSGSDDHSIRIWNATTGKAIGDPLQGHSKGVTSVTFSPNGKKIVSGAWDTSIRVWNVDTVTPFALSPDDQGVGNLMQEISHGNQGRMSHTYTPNLTNPYYPFCWCYIDTEGWLHGWHHNLKSSIIIIWIPPKYQSTLVFPPTEVLRWQDGYCTLDLHNFVHGKDWVQCSMNSIPHSRPQNIWDRQ
ncbi:WD40-repeat-containing domain protein [Lentinula guzmanii]|uniref:WD40-repeat-containing domain protein n=1 Tax=Lentinula guzmanii TaxID=2804957 RepID=A0AA38MWK3_9AGAR|nr:WD40-repeat-containing domain protein [Lentinula guzmanii]KAJ3796297.1 WD40-repeat-containing domain protein [Lentinula aff. detonsa]